jgi:hypothetical protein
MSIGGWFYYATAGGFGINEFGVGGVTATKNEGLVIINTADSKWAAFGWVNNSSSYNAIDPEVSSQKYNFTVQLTDSAAATATSEQVVRITDTSGLVPGWYFVVATWENGVIKLYVDSDLVATSTPPAAVKNNPVTNIQVGNPQFSTTTVAALDECFWCDGDVLTQEEITWLYNLGNGRSYADIVSAG